MRRVKHILSYVLVLSMCFTLFFMPKYIVYADNPTYINVSECTHLFTFTNNSVSYLNASSEIRVVAYRRYNNDNSSFAYSFVSDQPFTFITGSSACGTNPSTTPSHVTVNNTDYYIFTNWFYDNQLSFNALDINPFYDTNTSVSAVYYTFGDGAIDPEPPGPTYGKPYDVEYSTRIVGSGLASADNIDRIVWNRAVDTNGNELPTGARVQIRAIPGKYIGNTANEVLTKSYTDFILDHSKQLIIVDIIASRGVYETKWSEVVDHFGFFPYSWVPNIQYIDNEYFKMGWIYQIRLQVDDYYSDWTNIYTATGSGASESQTITDSDEISQQLVQDINIVNQLNNTTTTNWYINETTINNSEYTENTNGKPWWAYLLEAILSLFQIGDGEQQTINNTNNLNIDLNDKLNEYNEIEDQQLNNLDNNLEAIEVESDMLENNKFVGSANWVAQQYTRMTNGTVIGSLIGFSLLFGLALIFIGKIR